MVKVNENKADDVMGHGPMSSMSSDGSFVVLERSPPQEITAQFPSHIAQQNMGFPPMPSHNFSRGLESQLSQNSSMLPNSLSSDLSPEEIQRKLHELLQENLELKETLRQNNLAMKQQFTTLMKWQDEVFKVAQTHKSKFAETKDLVLKLRAENTELKRVLEEYKHAGSATASEAELKMENVELKGKIAELQQKLAAPIPRKDIGGPPSKKEMELSALLEQVNRQLETAERARRQLTVDVERVTAQRTRLERDLAAQKGEMELEKEQLTELRKERDALNYKLAVSRQVGVGPTPEVSDVQYAHLLRVLDEQKAQINVLMQQLKEERAKAAALTTQGHIPSTQIKPTSVRDCEIALENLNGCLDQEVLRLSSLDSWLEVAAGSMQQWKDKQYVDMNTVATLQSEIVSLRNLLSQEQALGVEKKQSLDEAQKRFQRLLEDYQNVVKELELVQKEQQSQEHQNSAYQEVQARGFREKIDRMTAQLMNKDEAITQKDKELTQLKDKLKKLELENEAITILKAQVEVYQSDFNAEREARENLAGEKERLAEDLRHLQRRNQQLLDELETYQQNQFEQIQRQTPQSTSGWNTIAAPGRAAERHTPARTSPARLSTGRPSPGPRQNTPSPQPTGEEERPFRIWDEEVPPPKRYFCPVCNVAFAQVDHLEYHVETCLE